MSDTAAKYKRLETRLFEEELPQDEEDGILEEMDSLWWLMTSEERAAANDRRGTAQ